MNVSVSEKGLFWWNFFIFVSSFAYWIFHLSFVQPVLGIDLGNPTKWFFVVLFQIYVLVISGFKVILYFNKNHFKKILGGDD